MDEARARDAGKRGETIACTYLIQHGCRILARNWHSRYGEIDVIAANERHLIFLEVKTRAPNALVGPLEAVTPAKQRRLIQTAQLYLLAHPTNLQPRFDVMGIVLSRDGRTFLHFMYVKNAFPAEKATFF